MKSYFEFLRKRSLLGLLYRFCFLYPRISKNISGVALDVGCGIGDFLRFRRTTIGLDINNECVNYCQRLGLDARVMKEDEIPIDNQSVDTVILDNVLEHILSPNRLLGEVHKCLKPNGKLLIGIPGEKGYLSDDDHKYNYKDE